MAYDAIGCLRLTRLKFAEEGETMPRFDPVAVVRMDGQEFVTGKTTRPLFGDVSSVIFNETFEISVHTPNVPLTITVWNKDLFDASQNIFLGQAVLTPSLGPKEEAHAVKLKKRTKHDRNVSGVLNLRLFYSRKMEVGTPLLLSKTSSIADLASQQLAGGGSETERLGSSGAGAVGSARYTPRHKKGMFKAKKKSRLVWGRPYDPSCELITQCLEYLFFPSALKTDGLFRVPAARADIEALRTDWEFGASLDRTSCPDPHVVAGLLMNYLLQLPEPLIPTDSYALLLATDDCADNEYERLATLRKMVNTIPQMYLDVLSKLFAYLASVAQYAQENHMTVKNLAICFGPVLLRCKEGEESPMQAQRDTPIVIRVVTALIEHYSYFFENGQLNEDAVARSAEEDVARTASRGSRLGILSPRLLTDPGSVPSPEQSSSAPHHQSPAAPVDTAAAQPIAASSSGSPPILSPRSGRSPPHASSAASSSSSSTLSPLAMSSAPSATTSKRISTDPEKFFALQEIVLTAIRTVLRYMDAMRAEVERSPPVFPDSHILPSMRMLDGIVQLLTGACSAEQFPELFVGEAVLASPTLAAATALDGLRAKVNDVVERIVGIRSMIQDEAILLNTEKAVETLVHSGHILRDIGKLLDNFQDKVRRFTDLQDQTQAVQRLQRALVSALGNFRNEQLPNLRRALNETATLEEAVVVTSFLRALEKALESSDLADVEALRALCQSTPPASSSSSSSSSSSGDHTTLVELSLVTFDRIDALIARTQAAIQAATNKTELSQIAHRLRGISGALEQFLLRVNDSKANLSPPSSPAPAAASPASPGSSEPVAELQSKRQTTLDVTLELQTRLNNLRIDLESAPPVLLVSISRCAASLAKLLTLGSLEEKEKFVEQLLSNPVQTRSSTDIDPTILNSLKSRSATVLDEARAWIFRERRQIAKVRTVDELAAVHKPVALFLKVINYFLAQL